MARAPKIYQKLRIISKMTGWPLSYLSDCGDQNRRELQKAEEGDRLIWMLRSDGTTLAMYPKTLVRLGVQSLKTYAEIHQRVQFNADWVKANYDEYVVLRKGVGIKFYRIEVGRKQRGTVEQISPDEALKLTYYDINEVHRLYHEAIGQPLQAISNQQCA